MAKFDLQSEFKPTGDQPAAIDNLVSSLQKKVKHQVLWGVTGSGKTFTIANIINAVQRPTLVIAHNKTLAAQLADEFRMFFPNNAVHYFVSYYDYYQPEAYVPITDTYIEKDSSINDEIDRLRHAATHALMTRSDVIIVASVSCIYGIGSPEFYQSSNFTFRAGEATHRQTMLELLCNQQYERNDIEMKRGTFRIKGDTLNLFPAYADTTIRVEFFGDMVEKITECAWPSGEAIARHDSFEVFPAKHFITPDSVREIAVSEIRADLEKRLVELKKQNKLLEVQRLEQRTNYDLEMLEQTGTCAGIENYSRYFDRRKPGDPATTLIDYFPKDFFLVVDESHMTVSQIGAMYGGDRSRKEKLVDYGFRLPSAFDNRPLRYEEFYKKIDQAIFVSATPGEYELKKASSENQVGTKKQPHEAIVRQFIRPTGLLDPEIEVRPTAGQVKDLIAEIRLRVEKEQRVLVTTLTKRMAEELTEYLKENGVKVAYIHSDVGTLERSDILHSLRLGHFDVLVGINLLREGLDLPEVSFVAILDADKEGFLRSRTSLIQTIGRAARHSEGKVIMYADKITESMRVAIEETTNRRAQQEKHNTDHGITPLSISKAIKPKDAQLEEELIKINHAFKGLPRKEKRRVISELESLMHAAAEKLEFERAAELRDQITDLEALL